jgi:hypothetical protein
MNTPTWNGLPIRDFAAERRQEYEDRLRRFVDNIDKVYPAVFPDGIVVDDGRKLRLGNIEMELTGVNAGHWVDSSTRRRGDNLIDLAEAPNLDWMKLPRPSIEVISEIIAGESLTNRDRNTIGRLQTRWDRWLARYHSDHTQRS